ncbi:MAG: sugar-transfer associated ATP-grasp domain-containing protein [Clostridia bacterium]|nr:sugar-transfer associated ATP-grasp domain-containing protein [Clostridia bacterium]
MYWKSGTILLLREPDSLMIMSKRVANKYKRNRLCVMLDALYCSYKYGTSYSEYEALDFISRTAKNRATYVTVFWHLENLKKYNPAQYGAVFRNKRVFNEVFLKYTKKKWLDLSVATEQEITDFLDTYEKVVLKNSDGCSGKQVLVVDGTETSREEILSLIHSGKYNMVENCIINAPEMASFNPTSLNTIRIVTVHSENTFNIVGAFIRIGAIGSRVDNISMGGSSAIIDVSRGRIITPFRCNDYRRIEGTQDGRNDVGFEIPYWKETIEMLKEAATVVPQVHIIGWDVAITKDGPVLIEGNESFGTSIMQYYYSADEDGIKERMQEMIDKL